MALSSLDMVVNRGDLFGFIGSNGAGKTTTLRILATFLSPSSSATATPIVPMDASTVLPPSSACICILSLVPDKSHQGASCTRVRKTNQLKGELEWKSEAVRDWGRQQST
jgi:ABC-type uncharacterized transport system ATPase subunit